MPFQKGEGGRPRGASNKATKPVKDALAKLGGVGGAVYAKGLHELTTHEDAHVRVKALTLALAYLWGKPTERHEHSGLEGGPVHVHHHFAATS